MKNTQKFSGFVRLLGIVVLVELVVLVGVWVSCLLGEICSLVMWSNRMFMVGLLITLVGGALAVSYLGSGRLVPKGYSGHDAEAWESLTIRGSERETLEERKSKIAERGRWSLGIGAVGIVTIVIGILIDVLSR